MLMTLSTSSVGVNPFASSAERIEIHGYHDAALPPNGHGTATPGMVTKWRGA